MTNVSGYPTFAQLISLIFLWSLVIEIYWIHLHGLSSLDVCSNEDLPEVELVSLLEEQLPQYRLRVDSLFLYENQDWSRSPHQQRHAPDALSPVLAEETFRYMSEYFFTLLEFVHWNKSREYLGIDF